MARKVRWSKKATKDLDEIAEFIARGSEVYAMSHVRRVRQAAIDAALFPLSGHIVPEWKNPLIREIPFRGYRLIYRIVPDAIIMVSVSNGARRLADEPPQENEAL